MNYHKNKPFNYHENKERIFKWSRERFREFVVGCC